MLPVTVVTGFLGAGKTTLVNTWLAGASQGEVAVVVNELGDVGIDGELLAERVRTLVEITGGCVCCRSQAELVDALEGLATSSPAPSRVVVETSGAASPSGVLRALAGGGPSGQLRLDGVITVVDAQRASALASHDLAVEQIACADVVVLSRADLCDDDTLAEARARVSAWTTTDAAVAASRGVVQQESLGTLEALVAHARTALRRGSPREGHPATHPAYTAVSLVCEGDVDGEAFAAFMEDVLSQLGPRLLRMKGIVSVDGLEARMIVQGVAELVELTFGAPWGDARRETRLVVVGLGLDAEALTRAFASVAART
jgi:G3E family GTPase